MGPVSHGAGRDSTSSGYGWLVRAVGTAGQVGAVSRSTAVVARLPVQRGPNIKRMLIITGAVFVLFAALGSLSGGWSLGLWIAGFIPFVWGIVQLFKRRPTHGLTAIGTSLAVGIVGLTLLPAPEPAPATFASPVSASPTPTPSATPSPSPTPTPTPSPTPEPPPPSPATTEAPPPAPTTQAPPPPPTTTQAAPATQAAPPTTTRPAQQAQVTRTTTAPKRTTQAPKSVSYANCTEVRAAGADPIYRGQPGYSSKLDRDGDGVACE